MPELTAEEKQMQRFAAVAREQAAVQIAKDEAKEMALAKAENRPYVKE